MIDGMPSGTVTKRWMVLPACIRARMSPALIPFFTSYSPGLIGSSPPNRRAWRSEEHTSELQSLMRISYAVFCLKKKNTNNNTKENEQTKQDRNKESLI